MSELPPTPLQVDIDRNGGLYDQALEQDRARFSAQKDEQDAAYTTYEDNISATQEREQEEAYATYHDNIMTTQRRERKEAYANSEFSVRIDQIRREAELREAPKKLRKEKIKRGLGKVAAAVLMIPGVDIVAEMVDEEIISSKLNKKRRDQYKDRNGTLLGNKAKGYTSTLGKSYVENSRRFTDKSEPIIKDLETLIAEHEQRTR